MELELPEHVAGGYRSTPGTLELRFWQDRRPSIRVGTGPKLGIECAALSAEGLRVQTADPAQPGLLIHFENCQ